ncbi:MAG: protease modulator HflK [Pedosphaera sp.]|nr:protease modulator HflK [Pedosphaera sp.]
MSNEQKNLPSDPSRHAGMDSGSQALAEALASSFAVVKYVMAGLFVLFLISGCFQVKPQQQAIILHFGKPSGAGDKVLLGPGLHWAFPYPIDEVIKIPITEIQKVTARGCWFAQTTDQEALGQEPPPGPTLNPAIDGYALTADGNIVHTKATLSYRIDDPVRCVFDFASDTNQSFTLAGVSNAVVNALNNSLVSTAARFKMDDLLLKDASGFQDAVRRRVTKLIEDQKLGVVVDQCVVQSREPRQLKQAFANVTIAGQKSTTVISGARAYENERLNRASSDATNRINLAQVERKKLIDDLTAFAATYGKVLPKYSANPELFRHQRLVETMGRVFASADKKMFLPTTPDGKPAELRLLLSPEPPKQKTEEAKP